jgi:hypothetical protein
MRNQSKPHNRTRVVLDESEIQRRMTRPKKPTLAERYAQETDFSARNRFYSEAPPRSVPQPKPRPRTSPAPKVWVTRPILSVRGWTDVAIRNFLPEPQRRQSNPHPQGGNRPMSMWKIATVARAEATDAWRQWLCESLRRRGMSFEDLADLPRGEDFRRRVQAVDAAIIAWQTADAERRHSPSSRKEPGPGRQPG